MHACTLLFSCSLSFSANGVLLTSQSEIGLIDDKLLIHLWAALALQTFYLGVTAISKVFSAS